MITINNRDTLKWQEGLTVRKMLELLGFTYSQIVVSVNGSLVPPEEFENFAVPDESRVDAIHIHHGG